MRTTVRSLLCLMAVIATAALLLSSPAQGTAVLELAYLDTPGNVWLTDANGQHQRKLLDGGRCGGPWGQLSWSPAGDRLACLRRVGKTADEYVAIVFDLSGRVVQQTRVLEFGWSPTGRYLVYDVNSPPHPRKGLHTYVVTDKEGRVVARIDASRGEISWGQVAWSPNGSAVAYVSAPHRVGLYDLATGRRRILSIRIDGVLMWVRGGRALLVGTNLGYAPSGEIAYKAQLLDLERGVMSRVSVLDGVGQTWLSPDGRRLVFSDLGPGGEMGILDLRTLKLTRVDGSSFSYPADGYIPPGHAAFSADSSTVYWADYQSGPGFDIYRSRVDGRGYMRVGAFPQAEIVAFSPDPQQIAYSTLEGRSTGVSYDTIWTARLGGGQARRIGSHPQGIQDFAWRPRLSR